MCAALEWAMGKRPKRAPTFARVDDLPKNMRDQKIGESRMMISPDQGSLYTVEILSVTHDVLAAHLDRDFRTIRLFLLDGLQVSDIQETRIVEVNEARISSVVRNSPLIQVNGEIAPLYSIAHRAHMRWLQPTVHTRLNLREDWRRNFDRIRDIKVL